MTRLITVPSRLEEATTRNRQIRKLRKRPHVTLLVSCVEKSNVSHSQSSNAKAIRKTPYGNNAQQKQEYFTKILEGGNCPTCRAEINVGTAHKCPDTIKIPTKDGSFKQVKLEQFLCGQGCKLRMRGTIYLMPKYLCPCNNSRPPFNPNFKKPTSNASKLKRKFKCSNNAMKIVDVCRVKGWEGENEPSNKPGPQDTTLHWEEVAWLTNNKGNKVRVMSVSYTHLTLPTKA